jgi:hypothetical protein
VAALLVALGCAELALRIAGVGTSRRGSPWFAGGSHPRFLFAPDPERRYVLRPGFRGEEIAASGEFRLPVEIDGQGLRKRTAGPYRPGGILAVGDSMTFGEGVRADETWPSLLERELGIPVLNAGVPGYSSAQMAAQLDAWLGPARPRWALLTFSARWDLGRCENPFVYKEGFIVSERYAARLHRVGDNLYLEPLAGRVLGPLSAQAMGRSVLARLVLSRWVPPRAQRHRPSWSAYAPCLDALARVAATAEQAGCALHIVLIDSPSPGMQTATRQLRARLAARRLPTWSLDELLAGKDLKALRFASDDHWRPGGHRAVAAALAAAFKKDFAQRRKPAAGGRGSTDKAGNRSG